MSVEVRDFVPEIFRSFSQTAAELSLRSYLETVDLDALAKGPSYSIYWEGWPIACGGFVEVYKPNLSRAIAWGIVGDMPRRAFPSVHKIAWRGLREAPYRRIEAQVVKGFESSHRWARLLGFTEEAPLECWTPDGEDVIQYKIIKDNRQ